MRELSPAEKVEQIMLIAQDVVSLNAVVNSNEQDEPAEILDFITDNKPGPEELAEKADSKRLLLDMIDKYLLPREIAIIRMRFGFTEKGSMTLEDIGKVFNLTRERVRQIEVQALKKLRLTFKKKNITREDL